MGIGHFIRMGDKTTCGGEVLEGDTSFILDGQPRASEGDRVSCGVDGETYTIVGGVSYFLGNGRLAAGSLDSFSSCPCEAGLIASAFFATYRSSHDVAPQATRAVAQPESQPDNTFTTKPQSTFAQAFTITNSETGQPLANREFVAVVDGRETRGVTDACGLAHIRAPSMDSVISLHVLFKSPVRTLTELSENGR
jgi:uncharacterized Zn-binding protein involved in type VI secretion